MRIFERLNTARSLMPEPTGVGYVYAELDLEDLVRHYEASECLAMIVAERPW